jgi:hypothetical protein
VLRKPNDLPDIFSLLPCETKIKKIHLTHFIFQDKLMVLYKSTYDKYEIVFVLGVPVVSKTVIIVLAYKVHSMVVKSLEIEEHFYKIK